MNKQELLANLEESRLEFDEVLASIPKEDFSTPGVCGDWSIKDLLVHLTLWEAELIRMLWQIRQGEKPSTGQLLPAAGIETLNHKWYRQYKNRSLESAQDDFDAIREQTIRRVKEFSSLELFEANHYSWSKSTSLARFILESTTEHEAGHLQDLMDWIRRSRK